MPLIRISLINVFFIQKLCMRKKFMEPSTLNPLNVTHF